MLTELSVENVALIEEATLELSPGLNVITGETGAGKTLLATALQMLLGGRARSETVRSGARRATVEGTFVLPEETGSRFLIEALGDLAEEVEDNDGLVLRRTLTGEGRSRCYVGGVSVPVRALASLGERLVSYHSHREQTRLTEPAEQLAILDDFLDPTAAEARHEHELIWRAVENDRAALQEIRTTSESRLREVEFLRYQVTELESAGYDQQELSDLSRERDRLRNVTDLLQATSAASAGLSSEDGTGAVDAVARAASELETASRYDDSLSGLLKRLHGISAELDDVLYELRSYLEELEADPNRLEAVEDRLAAMRALERKYGDVEGYLQESRERLSRLENLDEETARLEESLAEGALRLGRGALQDNAGHKARPGARRAWCDVRLRRGRRRYRRRDGNGGRSEAEGTRRPQPGPYHYPPPSDSLRGGHARHRRKGRGRRTDDHPHRAYRGRGAPQGARQDALRQDRRGLPGTRIRTPGQREIGPLRPAHRRRKVPSLDDGKVKTRIWGSPAT